MATRKAVSEQKGKPATGEVVEQKVMELAEQLGWFLGKVQAKADGWLESEAVQKQLGQIRDGAADLLEHVKGAGAVVREAAAKSASAAKISATPVAVAPIEPPAQRLASAPSALRRSKPNRGAVDAPGKRHRKPPPQERVDKRMGEAVGKKMGQKSFQVGKSRGRG
jgi:hypothetical protein